MCFHPGVLAKSSNTGSLTPFDDGDRFLVLMLALAMGFVLAVAVVLGRLAGGG